MSARFTLISCTIPSLTRFLIASQKVSASFDLSRFTVSMRLLRSLSGRAEAFCLCSGLTRSLARDCAGFLMGVSGLAVPASAPVGGGDFFRFGPAFFFGLASSHSHGALSQKIHASDVSIITTPCLCCDYSISHSVTRVNLVTSCRHECARWLRSRPCRARPTCWAQSRTEVRWRSA